MKTTTYRDASELTASLVTHARFTLPDLSILEHDWGPGSPRILLEIWVRFRLNDPSSSAVDEPFPARAGHPFKHAVGSSR